METHYIKTKIETPKIFLFFYIILIIVKLSLSKINEEYNIQNINNKLIDNKNTYEKDIFFKINNNINFKDEDKNLFLKSEELGENEFEFNKITNKNINKLPLKLYCKIPYKNKNDKNFNNLLFNLYLIDHNDNKTLNDFNDCTIKSIIIKNSIFEDIQNNKINDEDIFNNNKVINSKFDLSTKSVDLKINKNNFIKDIQEEEDIYLYIKIDNKNKPFFNIEGNIMLIKDNYKIHFIPKDYYINNKIYYDVKKKENNYDLYHLQSDYVDDTFSVDFCSNYGLNRGIYISFLDYNENKTIKYDDISTNSTNIILMKSKTKKGKTYHFEFKLKNKKKDIVFCIYSKNKPSDIKSYNYIFKYNTNTSINLNYELNNETKIINDGKKTKLILDNIKIINDSITQYLQGEIYIRKIINNNKKKREEIDTIGIIESKYELVNGIISYTNDNKKIQIEIPKINEKNYYSIFIYLPYVNEKFVYNTINNHEIKRNYLYVILIFTGVPLYLGIVIGVIIFALKYKNDELNEKILKTSFQEGGIDDNLREDEDNNLE